MLLRAVPALLFAALTAPPAAAQTDSIASALQDSLALPPAVTAGDELTVALVTVGYGEAIWQNFGHNAIWIHDASRGTDVAYNYGMFDFAEPGFLTRFLQGEMQYWMAALDFQRMREVYAEENRTIWSQELNLTGAEKLELRAFLERNALPENRAYRYDYFRDNCSTRVRDALDAVLDGALRAKLSAELTDRTYRSESLRLTSASVPLHAGMDLGLGPFADRPLTAWEESFIPMRLRDHVRGITVAGPDGPVPLVVNERILYQSTLDPPPDVAPSRLTEFLAFGLLGFLLVWGLSRFVPDSGAATIAVAALVFVWALLTGVLGVVLAGLWIFTDHAAAFRNANLLQANPLALVFAVVGPMAILGDRARNLALALAILLAGLSAFELVLHFVPGIDQTTGRIIALFLPIHLGVLLAVLRAVRPPPTSRKIRTERAWRAREARASGRHR